MSGQSEDKYKRARELGMLTTIPVLLAVSPLVGYFLGKGLDGWLGTHPWLTWILVGLGFVAGVRETIRILGRVSKD